MFLFVVLMVLISSALMVEPCGQSPPGGGSTAATTAATTTSPIDPKDEDDARQDAAANLAEAEKILANANVDSEKVKSELATYAKDPVHMNAVKDILKNNLPSTVTVEEYNAISADIQAKFDSGELNAMESYKLILNQIKGKAGTEAAALTEKVNVYFNKPEHLIKLQDIIKAQNPNADPAVATAVANALKAT